MNFLNHGLCVANIKQLMRYSMLVMWTESEMWMWLEMWTPVCGEILPGKSKAVHYERE